MSDVFVLRHFEEALTDESFEAMTADSAGCLDLYRVQWRQSLLSTDGHRLFCWFWSPDAESTRQALRKAGSHTADPWSGSVHDAPSPDAPPAETANVVVERSFDAPVQLADLQAVEDAAAACLETRDVRFVRTFFSKDRRRMICLYRAPDAEAVREAQRMAGMPFDAIWPFRLKA